MAYCRCEIHKPKNANKHVYSQKIEPLGFPNSAIMCDFDNKCTEKKVWVYLHKGEVAKFKCDRVINTLSNRIRVADMAVLELA